MSHNEKIKLIFLCLIGFSASFPVGQDSAIQTKVQLSSEKKGNAVIKIPKQDGDGDGDSEGGFSVDGIGNNLSKIVSGAVTGNLGSIFGGSAAFIGDGDTQSAVSKLLTQVSNPINKVVQTGLTNLAGGTVATTAKAVTAAATTKKPTEADEEDDDDEEAFGFAAVARA